MELYLEKSPLSQLAADLLVLGVFQDENIDAVLKGLDPVFPDVLRNEIVEIALAEKFLAKSKESLSVFTGNKIAAKRIVLLGLGKASEYSASVVRKATANLARKYGSKEVIQHVALQLRFEGNAELLQAAVEGWFLGTYTFLVYKDRSNAENVSCDKTKRIIFAEDKLNDEQFVNACATGRTIAECTNLARDLVAEPACVMTPTRLAEIALSFVDPSSNLVCEILEAEEVSEIGMGSYLAVAQGSYEAPKFINLKYSPPNSKASFVLIGKGITFDSGGLSLKSAQGMETMKHDMSGAATVLGVIRALTLLQVPVEVQVLIAACENMPGGAALRPGDVVSAMNGKTIEVNNTDAEGRLTLADALCFACQQKPGAIIDIATLTGAVVTALGKKVAGIMGNNEQLVSKIIYSGKLSGELFWELPLLDEYKDGLKSDIADLKNAGTRGEAGACMGGMFLKEFVDDTPWVHLDVAGPAWSEKEADELNKGGTAFGVRTLCYFLLSEAGWLEANPV